MTAPPRSLSYLTMEWSVELDHAALTIIMDAVLDVWDHTERTNGPDEATAVKIEALVEHIARLRDWTGWGGVPEKFLMTEKANGQ